MKLNSIKNLIAKDINLMDLLIKEKLKSPIEIILNISNYIISCKGKRIRPLILLLSAKSNGYKKFEHIELAAIVEFIHTATLLHDDIIDNSKLRRGKTTVNNIWGNSATVLIGDFLYSKAFQMISKSDKKIINLLSTASNIIAEGEIQQLVNRNNIYISEEIYLDIIKKKTATLISCSSQIGCMLSIEDLTIVEKYKNYGLHLGMAFQIIDDILDYCSSKDKLGKNIGDDIRSGSLTLPIIHLLKFGDKKDKNLVKNMICNKKNFYENFLLLKKSLYYNGSIKFSFNMAVKEIRKSLLALNGLKENEYLLSLKKLSKLLLERYY
jgi:octaprenyl-diphosphate synthase